MKQEDIIRMAREADIEFDLIDEDEGQICYVTSEGLERFAALVEEAATEAANARANARANTSWSLMCKKMVAFENEACAKLVDHILKEGGGTWGDAIRARGNT
jgi:hypothetical protein